jgi:hypothetical protein
MTQFLDDPSETEFCPECGGSLQERVKVLENVPVFVGFQCTDCGFYCE